MKLAAKWILPITSEPIEDGVIAIEDGKIAAVGRRADFHGDDLIDLDDACILPGLINAHTHLELSHLQGQIKPGGDFFDWLTQILQCFSEEMGTFPISSKKQAAGEAENGGTSPISGKSGLSPLEGGARENGGTSPISRAAAEGAAQSLQAGVTTVGDISRFCDQTRPVLKDGPLRVVSFGEVLGTGKHRDHIEQRIKAAADRQHESEFLKVALSPHSPYSVEESGLKRTVHFARTHGMRTCIHAAETVEEIQFLQTGQGRLREFLESLGVWDDRIPIPRSTPIRWLCEMGLLGPECLLAHANYVDDEEIDLLCATGTSVAYCPRTHSRFGHANYPLEKLIGAGVNVCVGTDSLASNPSLSILEDLAHAHRQHPELSCETILDLGTINAARALGLADAIGALEPGKRADLAVFKLRGAEQRPDQALLEPPAELVCTYIDGRRVWPRDMR